MEEEGNLSLSFDPDTHEAIVKVTTPEGHIVSIYRITFAEWEKWVINAESYTRRVKMDWQRKDFVESIRNRKYRNRKYRD